MNAVVAYDDVDVDVDGGGVDVDVVVELSVMLDAVIFVAQVPVPVTFAVSPTTGFAPDGLYAVDNVVKTSMEPHPVPALTLNSVLLSMPVTGPLMVSVVPLCVYDIVVGAVPVFNTLGSLS